jgi:LysM repeat protein
MFVGDLDPIEHLLYRRTGVRTNRCSRDDPPEVSVAHRRTLLMDTALDDRTTSRRTRMSTLSISRPSLAPGLSPVRPRETTRPQPPAAPAFRLTRRGRLVAVLLLAVVIFGALTVLGSRSAATGESGVPEHTRTVEVGPGDTLWGIATEVAAPGEVGETVLRIERLNSLSGPALVVGQEIAVPVG